MDDSDQKVIDQIIDLELEQRESDEIAAAYRAICAMLIVKSATTTSKPSRLRKMEATQKIAARDWLQGGSGLITFEEACEALDVDPDMARRGIDAHAEAAERGAINKTAVSSRRTVFGRTVHVHDIVSKTESRPGMGTCNPDGYRHRGHSGWAGKSCSRHSSPEVPRCQDRHAARR